MSMNSKFQFSNLIYTLVFHRPDSEKHAYTTKPSIPQVWFNNKSILSSSLNKTFSNSTAAGRETEGTWL